MGCSYAGFLRGQPPAWRVELYFEYCCVRAIRTETLKYVERTDNWASELFDLEADPAETVNLIGERHHAQQLAQLRRRLTSFLKGIGAPSLAQWRTSTHQTIPIDSGYYDGWSKRSRND